MSKSATRHILDPDTLARMDAEFLSGAYDVMNAPVIPPLDPASDPFGRNFEWLNEPEAVEPIGVLDLIRSRPATEWKKEAGRVVRELALGGSLAGSNDEQAFQKWIGEGFVALSLASGAAGEVALAAARSKENAVEVRVETITQWLARLPQFQRRSSEELLAVAIAAVQHHSPSTP